MPGFEEFPVRELLDHITVIFIQWRLLVRGLVLTRDDWHMGHGFFKTIAEFEKADRHCAMRFSSSALQTRTKAHATIQFDSFT